MIEDVGRLASLRMVAFGAEPEKRSPHWVEACLEAFRQPAHIAPFADERLYCLGTTKDGQPIHPLARGKWRVPDDQQPIVWEAP